MDSNQSYKELVKRSVRKPNFFSLNGMVQEILKISEALYEIPRCGRMRVPGRIYANEHLFEAIKHDPCIGQVINVSMLPGVVCYSIAMPDIHWGYGFPIGGVAAMNLQDGVISPGGVGYDINCGVRLGVCNLTEEELRLKVHFLAKRLFKAVPAGLGASRAIEKLDLNSLKEVSKKGAIWAIEHGFGNEEDLIYCEENGRLSGVDTDKVSQRAFERGMTQLGTLGSGNHFLEVGKVEHIFDESIAKKLRISESQVYVMIHSGSRGFGHQICEDYIKKMDQAAKKYGIELPDRQLCCAPITSKEGRDYLNAMASAANFAWANRQVMLALTRSVFTEVFSMTLNELGMRLIYDVSHNIAKLEEHCIDGRKQQLCVHRKGATRSFPKNHPLVPNVYRQIGQPVIVPGDMGRCSYVLIGTEKALGETFGSSAHGAGRLLSRHGAIKKAKGRKIIEELKAKGITVIARNARTVAEEMSEAYKDVEEVVNTLQIAGLANKIARLSPLAVIKG